MTSSPPGKFGTSNWQNFSKSSGSVWRSQGSPDDHSIDGTPEMPWCLEIRVLAHREVVDRNIVIDQDVANLGRVESALLDKLVHEMPHFFSFAQPTLHEVEDWVKRRVRAIPDARSLGGLDSVVA
eukprot:4431108-Prymnesium_polylepis.1